MEGIKTRNSFDEYLHLHDMLSECVAVKVNGVALCFPEHSADASTITLTAGDLIVSLNYLESLPLCEISKGSYLVDFGGEIGKVKIQPLFGRHSFD